MNTNLTYANDAEKVGFADVKNLKLSDARTLFAKELTKAKKVMIPDDIKNKLSDARTLLTKELTQEAIPDMDNIKSSQQMQVKKVMTPNIENKFSDAPTLSAGEQIQVIYKKANKCRSNHVPTFAGEHKYLPVSEDMAIVKGVKSVPIKLTIDTGDNGIESLTDTQCKKCILIKGVLIGVGIAIVIKILSL
jgi:hypothetical protein